MQSNVKMYHLNRNQVNKLQERLRTMSQDGAFIMVIKNGQ